MLFHFFVFSEPMQVCAGLCWLRGVIQEINGASVKEGAPWPESYRHTMQQTVTQPV